MTAKSIYELLVVLMCLMGCKGPAARGSAAASAEVSKETANEGAGSRAVPDSGAERTVIAPESREASICEDLRSMAGVVGRDRHHPEASLEGKAFDCNGGLCESSWANEDFVMIVGWPEKGPGALFSFTFNHPAQERLTCEALGLHAFESEPGRERCKSTGGPAAGMTIVLDNLCTLHMVTFFDENYHAKDPKVGSMEPCEYRGGAADPRAETKPLRCPDETVRRFTTPQETK
jgi:hypothetical protein